MSVDCTLCREPIDIDGPAVVELRSDQESPWGWVEFLEDWRGDGGRFTHPICFAETHGVAKLVELVTKRERINRMGFWKLIDQRDELRRRLGSS
jgi:hypothetical protein